MTTRLLILSIMALAGNAWADPMNPLADLPWQNHPHWYNFPFLGYPTATMEEAAGLAVAKPTNPGTLFESINLYQPVNNPNAGSAIELTEMYLGLVWWDFIGGHHVIDYNTIATSNVIWRLNEALPLRLGYIEVTSDQPGIGSGSEDWYQIPFADSRDGLMQFMPNEHAGWVTHVNLYTRSSSVPDTGSTIWLTLASLASLAVLRRKI